MASQIPTEFSFPLRDDNQSSPINSSYSPKKSHSRTYTGIEIPISIKESQLQQSPSFSSIPLTPPDTLSVPKSPHKKHAHRRSAAISHDFRTSPSFIDFSASMNSQDQQSDILHSPYSFQSPALTFTSNSSSTSFLPMQSSDSLNSIDSTQRISWKSSLSLRKNKYSNTHVYSPPDSPRTSEDSIVSNSEFHSSSYISTSDITEVPYSNTIPLDVPIIDLDAALVPFSETNKYKRKSEISEPTIIEEEDEESPATLAKSAEIGQQQAASTSTTSLSSGTMLPSNRARAARNYNSFTLASLTTSSSSTLTAVSKEAKALHRLSSTTNETITPSVTPQLLPQQQQQQQQQQQKQTPKQKPKQQQQKHLSQQQQLPQVELEPATPTSLYKTKSVVSHRPAKRFSISSLTSFTTVNLESNKRKSRFWSWVRGRHNNK